MALVTVVDLTFEAKQINSITWLSAQCFGTALLIYYIISRLSLSNTTRSPYCLVTSENFTRISSELFLLFI